MYNLKEGKGTYKGLIGECLFKLTKRYLVLTKFFNKNKYIGIFGEKLTEEEKNFIEKNWFSIDGIGFDYTKRPRKVVLFEVKTENYKSSTKPNWIPKMTLATHKIYNEALKLGFDVKTANVLLYDNWEYDVRIIDFDKVNYCIDKPKKYDKKGL